MRNDLSVHRIVKTKKGPNQMIPEHRHSFFHYIYFLSGKASVTVGEEKLLAGARTLVLVSPNTSHSILGVELACSIDVKFSCSPALQETLMTLPGFLPALGNYEDSLLRGIFEEAVGQQEHFDELINVRLYELLILLLRSQHLCQSHCQEMIFAAGTAVSDPQMRKILAYIEANIRRPLRVTELAEVFGYNKNYFQSLFKKLIGINPSTYINQRKISHARQMILYSNLNVTQISENMGFQSIHYFSRLFKQLVGITPTEYICRTKQAVPINVVRNEYTPAEQFEIPLQIGQRDDTQKVMHP